MITLLLQRKWSVKDGTIGELFVDGVFECFSLEDIIRPVGEKVYGSTAIPSGSYKVVVDWSDHFKRNMPHILDVPGFEGVRIHSGNTPADTEGCILVGQTRYLDNASIGGSRLAYEHLFRKLQDEKEIMLTIKEI